MFCSPCVKVDEVDVNNALEKKPVVRHAGKELTTFGISFPGSIDLPAFQRYLDALLYRGSNGVIPSSHGSNNNTKSSDGSTEPMVESNEMTILRMKGVVHVNNEDCLFILQAVYDTFDIYPTNIVKKSPEDTTEGLNRFVFIGKNMDMAAISAQCQTFCVPTDPMESS